MNQIWRIKTVGFFFCIVLFFPQITNAAEQTSRNMWETFFINWLPMVLIVGLWFYVMRNMDRPPKKRQSAGDDEINQRLEKIEQSLERILKVIEKR